MEVFKAFSLDRDVEDVLRRSAELLESTRRELLSEEEETEEEETEAMDLDVVAHLWVTAFIFHFVHFLCFSAFSFK